MWRLRCTAAWALLLVLLSPAVSCKTSDDARAAATQMTATARNLSRYYAALSQVVDNHGKLERLQKATLGVPLDDQDLAQLKNIHEELEKRSQMAHSLADLAAALSELAGSKAPADVSDAAANLGTELSGIQDLPGASSASAVLQDAGKILTQFAQEHDERKMAKSMDPTMAALAQMFSQEKPAYDSINRTYIGLAQSLALELVNRNQVDPGSLMEPALEPFGLASRLPSEKVPQGLQDYAREQIQSRGQAEIAAHARASETLHGALKELSKRVHQLSTDGRMPERVPLKLSDVESWIKLIRSSAYSEPGT
jgi:hypothetical protein